MSVTFSMLSATREPKEKSEAGNSHRCKRATSLTVPLFRLAIR